ncbi:MAG: peptidoglycan DD-metalloendopeptidase family protein [Steroidobacteraceae bacterium]
MKRVPWTAAGLALLLAALVLPAAQPDRKRNEAELKAAELKALTEQLQRLQRQVQKDPVEEDRLTRALRDAERSESRASGELSALRSQRAQRSASRQQLVQERGRRQAEREATEADLASQLRAAYFMGRNEPLKLLLNQRNPAEFGRNLTYYGYLGRLRAGQINSITENIAKIDELTAQIDEEDAQLAELELRSRQRLGEREAARKQRGQVLASLQREASGRAAELRRLRAERQEMEKLLKELSRAAEASPYDPNSPFARLRGRLAWPVSGHIATNGGIPAGGTRSDGIEIDAVRGAEVRAVHDGRVLHADWGRGVGIVIIVDHGNDYWSIYGNNEQLFKQKGDKVRAGETIATVGDSGGRQRPGLHFEIRRHTKAVDPRDWFRTSAPPDG